MYRLYKHTCCRDSRAENDQHCFHVYFCETFQEWSYFEKKKKKKTAVLKMISIVSMCIFVKHSRNGPILKKKKKNSRAENDQHCFHLYFCETFQEWSYFEKKKKKQISVLSMMPYLLVRCYRGEG